MIILVSAGKNVEHNNILAYVEINKTENSINIKLVATKNNSPQSHVYCIYIADQTHNLTRDDFTICRPVT